MKHLLFYETKTLTQFLFTHIEAVEAMRVRADFLSCETKKKCANHVLFVNQKHTTLVFYCSINMLNLLSY